jgi:hypothetical protein
VAVANAQTQGTAGATNIDVTQPGGWASAILAQLGAPHDPATPAGSRNIAFLEAWRREEGTKARFNPLATTLAVKGSTSCNSVGVQDYATPADGIAATARTLLSGYPHVVAAFRAGDPAGILQSAGGQSDLNRWVSGKSIPGVTSYISNISSLFFGALGQGKDAADWTSFDIGDAANAAGDAAGAIISAVPGVGSLASIAQGFGRVVATLLDANTWRRAGLALLGVVMMLAGGFLLAKQTGGMPSVVPIPV